MSYFGKNVKKIRGVKKLSQQQFAELFDLKRATLGAYEEGRSEPKIDTIIKVANYFSIPVGDLLTKDVTINKLLQFKGDVALQESIYQEDFAEIPCITEKNYSDYVKFYSKNTFINDLPKLCLPINPTKNFRGFTIMNLEMTSYDKGLYPKDVVVGEFAPREVYEALNDGTLVLVLVNEKLVLRRLFSLEEGSVLRADHNNVDDINIDMSSIKELWVIRYVFSRKNPEKIEGIEEKLELIIKKFGETS